MEKMGNFKTWINKKLDSILPYRHTNRILDTYIQDMKAFVARLDTMTAGEGFSHMGELPKGDWIQTEEGVLTRLIFLPSELDLLPRRITIMESQALKDTFGVRIHNHSTDTVHSNQVIFVEEGEITASVHEGPNGAKVYSSNYGPGTMVTFTPEQWHSVNFRKGAKVISIFFPAI